VRVDNWVAATGVLRVVRQRQGQQQQRQQALRYTYCIPSPPAVTTTQGVAAQSHHQHHNGKRLPCNPAPAALTQLAGGHLNPAITIAMFLARRISLLRAIVYIIYRLSGAIVGSALVRAVDPAGFKAALGAANRLNSWANVGTGLGAEIILTAIFVFVVFAAVDQRRGAHSAHVPVLAPLAIGIVVFLAHIVAVPIDGCSVNPARSFGAAVVARTWHHHWIFWVGPIIGGAAAGLLYEHLAYRAPVFGGPVERSHREPGTSPAGPQEYTV
jgi:aquaporin PIP